MPQPTVVSETAKCFRFLGQDNGWWANDYWKAVHKTAAAAVIICFVVVVVVVLVVVVSQLPVAKF